MMGLVSVDVGVSDSISSLSLAISSGEGLANKEPMKVANMMATKATNEEVLTAGESSEVPIDFTGDK
ncbi:cysteinyl-tRNA synthetase [Lyngbya sp. PCC 8106]|nr:cysteinyl-tRNA synthetase [Lyngbya sp. PCC 8106]